VIEPYNPEGWHDFFLACAGAAASLTGLLFVSLSLHVRFIASSETHRNTARGSLIGLVMVLAVSLVVLVRQPQTWMGVELAIVNLSYIVAVGAFQAARLVRGQSVPIVSLRRAGLGYLLALSGIYAAYSVYTGTGPGLYVVAFEAVAIIIWNLRNSWYLLMSVVDRDLART
jgi:hypothetical protein